MSALDLEAIRHRADAATEGPWFETYPNSRTIWSDMADSVVIDRMNDGVGAGVIERVDAEFIAHARTDIPDLLTEVTRLRSLVEEAASALVQRGFTDRAQWLRNKAENGGES